MNIIGLEYKISESKIKEMKRYQGHQISKVFFPFWFVRYRVTLLRSLFWVIDLEPRMKDLNVLIDSVSGIQWMYKDFVPNCLTSLDALVVEGSLTEIIALAKSEEYARMSCIKKFRTIPSLQKLNSQLVYMPFYVISAKNKSGKLQVEVLDGLNGGTNKQIAKAIVEGKVTVYPLKS